MAPRCLRWVDSLRLKDQRKSYIILLVILMNERKEDFLERILGITKLWCISSINEETEAGEIHIYLDFPKGTKFKCPNCLKEVTAHDKRVLVWRHLNLWQYKTYIHAKVPRVKCCGKTATIRAPWAREDSHFTLLMEDNIVNLAKMSTISKVANYLDEHDTKIWRVIHYYVNKGRNNADFSKVVNIGIDETSKQGHNYITNFVNLDTRRVMYVADGKDHKTIHEFVKDFTEHGGNPEKIKNVTSDMSLAFEKGIKECFPKASIIIDKFHVIKHANDGVNKVRIAEAKDNELLKNKIFMA